MEIHPVTPERWPDLADLFTRPGPRGGTPMTAGCWCMWWLLDAAVKHAFERGAAAVEAYPHVGGDYMGATAWFERRGFEPIRQASVRTIVRLTRMGETRFPYV
jgi:hypothetical protein